MRRAAPDMPLSLLIIEAMLNNCAGTHFSTTLPRMHIFCLHLHQLTALPQPRHMAK